MLDYFKICRFGKRIGFHLIRYPCIRLETIGRNIASLVTSRYEFNEYLHISSNRSLALIVIFSIYYLILSIKTGFVPIYILSFYNHRSPADSFEKINSNSYKFNCITSNCSRLSKESQLFDDFTKIPMFAICNQKVNAFYAPITDGIGPVGLLIHYTFALFALMAGFILPLVLVITPNENESIMFVVAPEVTVQLVLNRGRKLLSDLSNSYIQYGSIWIYRMMRVQEKYLIDISKHRQTNAPISAHKLHFDPKSYLERVLKTSSLGSNLNDELSEYVRDCLPLIRSDWWRYRSAFVYCLASFLLLSGLFSYGFLCTLYFQFNIGFKKDLLREFSIEMSNQRCALWTDDENIIDLKHTDILEWSFYSMVENISAIIGLFCNISTIITYYYLSHCELNCWLMELRTELTVAIEFIRFRDLLIKENRPSQTNKSATIKLKSDIIRQRCKEMIDVYLVFLIQKPMSRKRGPSKSKLDSKIACQEFAIDVLSNEQSLDVDSLVDLLEKLYISMRLFVDLVDEYSKNIALMVILINILEYTMAIGIVYISRQLTNFIFWPVFFVSYGLTGLALIISIPSNFHANVSSSLQP